jgi:putative flippase GtrA
MLDIVVKRLRAEAGKLDSVTTGYYSAVLTLLFRLHQSTFIQGQAIAALSAMTVNFAINNVFTHWVRQLLASRWLRG